MAADHLRDNLHDSRADVVQRGLYAVVVDDMSALLGARALAFREIWAPRVETPAEKPDAVTDAERVERTLAGREGVGRSDGRAVLAEISVQGYLRGYQTVSCLWPDWRPGVTFDEIVMSGMPTAWHRRELAFEQLIDHCRDELYEYRSSVRDNPDPLRMVGPLVADAVHAWVVSSPEALISGVRDLLARHRTDEEITTAVAASPADAIRGATLLIEETIDRRTGTLGPPLMAALVKTVVIQVIDVQWRQFLNRIGFLRRQGGVLYDPAGLVEQRASDVTALFAACRQAIRTDSIRYILELEPSTPPAMPPSTPRNHDRPR